MLKMLFLLANKKGENFLHESERYHHKKERVGEMKKGKILVVGFGPGDEAHMTFRAREAIVEADMVIGYKTYMDLVSHLIKGKAIIRTGMTEEVTRAQEAVKEAEQGKTVAVISSGDAGLYGMAGLVYEGLMDKGWKEEEGISVEVIDLRTVQPIDIDTIIASVEKTSRLIVVHEAVKSAGVGGEIAALVSEYGLFSLAAPIMRVTGYDTPYPVPSIEDDWLPTVPRLINAIDHVMQF